MKTKTGCVLPDMKERGESTYRNAEETMAANILGITSPTNTIKVVLFKKLYPHTFIGMLLVQ